MTSYNQAALFLGWFWRKEYLGEDNCHERKWMFEHRGRGGDWRYLRGGMTEDNSQINWENERAVGSQKPRKSTA